MFSYTFPIIRKVGDVLPYVEGVPGFIVKRDEENDLLIINYMLNTPDTFPAFTGDPAEDWASKIRRECRGITFRLSTGELLSRKYHKFFNLGERIETMLDCIDWTQPHRILEKLDGSMITPVIAGGRVRFCTKMGLTGVALPAEEFAYTNAINYVGFCEQMMAFGLTPVFEWCSRKQRIVLDYPKDALILTAIRVNVTGGYLTYADMLDKAAEWDIPVVKAVAGGTEDISEFLREMDGLEDAEGFVIRFDDGHMVKVKGAWYLQLHKMLDLLKNEKELIRLILEEKLDDVLSMVKDEDRALIERFEGQLMLHLSKMAEGLLETVREAADSIGKEETAQARKKAFALGWAVKDKSRSAMLFKLWDSADWTMESAWDIVKSTALSVLITNTKLEENRHIVGVNWLDLYQAQEE